MTTLILSVIGDDRTGLVDALAGPIAAHGGSWDRSSLARLAGKFAGIVVVDVPAANRDALIAQFHGLTAEGVLDIRVELAGDADTTDDNSTTRTLHLVGSDRPGIVSEIARALAEQRVSIEELVTQTSSAPMSAEPLFEATATLRLPDSVGMEDVQQALEEIANELMVDLDFTE